MAALIVAFIFQCIRAYCEYLVTAGGTAMGWRKPSWYDVTRDDDRRRAQGLPPRPGWMFWRDHWHLVQWTRNRSDQLGTVLAALSVLSLCPVGWWAIPLGFALAVTTWTAGHGVGFSAVLKWYNR